MDDLVRACLRAKYEDVLRDIEPTLQLIHNVVGYGAEDLAQMAWPMLDLDAVEYEQRVDGVQPSDRKYLFSTLVN